MKRATLSLILALCLVLCVLSFASCKEKKTSSGTNSLQTEDTLNDENMPSVNFEDLD